MKEQSEFVDERTFLLMPLESIETQKTVKPIRRHPVFERRRHSDFPASRHTSSNQFTAKTQQDFRRNYSQRIQGNKVRKHKESQKEERQLLLPVTPVPSERVDSESVDYYDYDYDYYMDFEVLKEVANKQTEKSKVFNGSDGRNEEVVSVRRDGERERETTRLPPIMGLPVKEHPLPGESQGCLYDCVYDCVSIVELTAYRDCVNFCGNTCKDK